MGQSLFNPEKITTIYSLLAAFLLVVEASLGLWLSTSDRTEEKITAGILITIVFIVFLYALFKINSLKSSGTSLVAEGIGELSPASSPVAQSSLQERMQDILIAPDRSYILQKPAQRWLVEELNYADFISHNMGIMDTELISKIIGERFEFDKILVIRSKSENYIYPIPGETLIDGRPMPTALSVPTSLRLSIIPLKRRQPPYYIERPFIHNYNLILSGFLNINVITQIKEEIISSDSAKRINSVFRQKIENAFYDDKKYKEILAYHTLIGIEGINKDYVLILQYLTTSQVVVGLDDDLKELQSLINSFQPINVIDSEKERREFEIRADEKFNTLFNSSKEVMFFSEFIIALMRIKHYNLNKYEDRGLIIRTLQPFESLSKLLNISYPELDQLWDALKQSEKGNSTNLKTIIPIMLDVALLKQSNIEK